MTSVSRRTLVTAVASLPLAGGNYGLERPLTHQQAIDPVVTAVRQWMDDQRSRDAMIREWQDWENALCARIRLLPMNLSQAGRSGLPEARAMRALDHKIKSTGKKLDRRAARLVLKRVTSLEGALAKIELGLSIQGPYDWEEYAFALIQDGCEQLRRRL